MKYRAAVSLEGDGLLTLRELASLLHVSVWFLRMEIKRGHLHVVPLSPRVIRILPSEAARYVRRAGKH